jgi:lysine-specific demethylase 8
MEIGRLHRPTARQFEEEYLMPGRPVVLTGIVDQWPSWGQWSPAWFGQRYGDLRLTGNNSLEGRREVLVRDYLAELADTALYLDALPLTRLQGMAEAVNVPDYCPSDRPTEVLVWVGPQGTCLDFHKDNHTPLDGNQNLLAQLYGSKRVVLVSPEYDDRMYPAPQAEHDYLRSQLRLDRPDPERFPLFEGVPRYETVVRPGELLYIPAHWWHYVRSLEISMTVTFWWRSSRIIELLGRFKEAAASGSLAAFLAEHRGTLGLRDVQQLGGQDAFRQLWQPLAPRVRELLNGLLDAELGRLVAI